MLSAMNICKEMANRSNLTLGGAVECLVLADSAICRQLKLGIESTEMDQRRSQDFHLGGAQLDGVVIVRGKARAWPALLVIGGGCGRGMFPLPPKVEAFGIFISTAINFY